MKSRVILNLFLLALVTGLGLLVYLKPKEAPQAEFPLSQLSANAIQHIKIDKTGQPPIEFVKRAGTWFMTSPFPARGDDIKITALLDILGAHSPQRFAADHLERYELDKPLLTLTLDRQTFQFGTVNPLSQAQYVNTDNVVYMIPTRFFASALTQPADFANKKLLAEHEIPTGFDFPDQKLSRNNGTWTANPTNATLSQDQLNSFAEEWRMASALISQPYDHSQPLDEFSIHLANGKTILVKTLKRQPELVLLRTDENLQYHFPEEVAKRLLLPH